jgi:integrase/recombinase XerD
VEGRIISAHNNNEENGMNRGRPKGTEKFGIKFLTDSQCEAFMKATKKNKRDSFLFSLCLFVGARVSELTQIKHLDVNEGSFQIFIKAKKNGTSRYYTLPGQLWKKYKRWMRERKEMKDADRNPYLFITRQSLHDIPMSDQAMKNAFKKYAAAAKLDNGFSVHSLRHTCAVMRIAEGTHVVKVQKWLRHKSLTSTMIYLDIASPEMKLDEREAAATFDKFL